MWYYYGMDNISWELQYNDIDRKIRIYVEPSDDTTTTWYDVGLLQDDGTYLVVDTIDYPAKYKDIDYVPGTYSLRRICTEILEWVPGKYINNGDTIQIYGNVRDMASHTAWNDIAIPVSVYLVPVTDSTNMNILKSVRETTTDKDGSFVIGGDKGSLYKLWIPFHDYNMTIRIPENQQKDINFISILNYRG